MDIEVNRERLLAALQIANAVLSSKAARDLSRNIKLEASKDGVTIQATDFESAVDLVIVPEKVSKPGKAVLPGEVLVALLRESRDETVKLSTDEWNAKLVLEDGEFVVNGSDPQTFPEIQGFSEAPELTFSAGDLRRMFERTSFAVATEGNRYQMSGVLIAITKEKVDIVASDGRRLALAWQKMKKLPEVQQVIVPRAGVGHFTKLLAGDDDAKVRLILSTNYVGLQTENGRVYSKLIDGAFPAYLDVFPKKAVGTIETNREALLAALRKAMVLTNPTTRYVTWLIEDGKLELEAAKPTVGEAKIRVEIAYKGKKMKVLFNPDYVAEYLKIMTEEDVTIELSGEKSAAVFKGDGPYSYILMPINPDPV